MYVRYAVSTSEVFQIDATDIESINSSDIY